MELWDRRSFLRGNFHLLSLWVLGCGAEANSRTGRDRGDAAIDAMPRDGAASRDAPGRAPEGDAAPDGRSGDASTGGSADGGPRPCETTRSDIEGPFFVPDSPERGDLREPGMNGTHLRLRGRVLDGSCMPVENAVVDLWQADDDGAYDTDGYRLRGHVRVDAAGRYEFSTIVPGHYLNGSQFRPAHLHVKVYVGASERLTTQLYFEGDPYNAIDPWFSEETLLRPAREATELVADFDFAV